MSSILDEGGALATIVGGLYAAIVRPWSVEARRRRADKRIMNLFWRGTPGVEGFYDAIATGPQRVKICEDEIKLLKDTYDKIKRGNEFAIALGKATDKKLDELLALWKVNGGKSNRPGEVQMRQAQRTPGVWLDNPIEDGEHD